MILSRGCKVAWRMRLLERLDVQNVVVWPVDIALQAATSGEKVSAARPATPTVLMHHNPRCARDVGAHCICQ